MEHHPIKDVDKAFAKEAREKESQTVTEENDEWAIGAGESDVIDADAASMIGSHEPMYVNPEQTMRLLAPRKPMTLEELRHKNPQLAVDYIYQRKEKWKAAAIRLNNRVKDLLVEVQTMKNGYTSLKGEVERKERETRHWKRKHRQEVDMKKWWRNAFAISAGITALTIVAMMMVTIQASLSRTDNQQYAPNIPRVPTSGSVQMTPNRVLASAMIYNGNKQGSGTIISKGDKYAAILTAAHNFNGRIGGEFWVYYPDGTFARATLVAFDPQRDLAVARVDASTILSHSFVPKEMPADTSFTCVGYSNGQGPNMNPLVYNSTYQNEHQKYMWDISLSKGGIWDGASGGGVFLGEACIGVTSQRNATYYNCQSQKMYAVCHQEIVNFLNENEAALEGCGDWSLEPEKYYGGSESEGYPPPWTPNSNVPINIPGNNIASLKEDVENLKEAVFGAQRRPSDVPSLPAAPTTSTGDEEPSTGQRLPSEVDEPPSPDEE